MNVRLTILLLVLLALIGGLVGVTQVLRSGDDDGATTAGLQDRLYRVSSDQLASFTISNDDEAITFVNEEGAWLIQDGAGGESEPVDPSRFGGVPLLVSGPSADKNLSGSDAAMGDLASFGLAPPRTTVVLTPVRGEDIELLIGDLTPTEDGYYAKLVGDDTIYVTNATWVGVVDRLLTDPPFIAEDDKLYLYNLGNDLIAKVVISKDGEERSLSQAGGQWYIEDSATGDHVPMDPNYSFGMPIVLTAPEVEMIPLEYDQGTEGLDVYGLEPPQAHIVVTTARGRVVDVLIGDQTQSGDMQFIKVATDDTVFVVISKWVQLFEIILKDPPYAGGAPSSE